MKRLVISLAFLIISISLFAKFDIYSVCHNNYETINGIRVIVSEKVLTNDKTNNYLMYQVYLDTLGNYKGYNFVLGYKNNECQYIAFDVENLKFYMFKNDDGISLSKQYINGNVQWYLYDENDNIISAKSDINEINNDISNLYDYEVDFINKVNEFENDINNKYYKKYISEFSKESIYYFFN